MVGIAIFAISVGIAVNVGISSKKDKHLSNLSLANVEALARPIVGIDPETGELETFGHVISEKIETIWYYHKLDNPGWDEKVSRIEHNVICEFEGSLTCPEQEWTLDTHSDVLCVGFEHEGHVI